MDEDTSPVVTSDGWEVLHLPWRLVERLPWLEEGSLVTALAGTGLLIFVAVVTPVLMVYTFARISDARARKRALARRAGILHTYDRLPEEAVSHLSVRQGVLRARASLLDTFTREWGELHEVLPELLNDDMVEETRARIEGTWSASRRRQFYLRYHFPLTTVMSMRRWEALFNGEAGDRTANTVPSVCGVGETDEGMYIIVSTAPGWTRHEWDDILPDIRVELDAPDASVEIVNSSEVIIALNDRHLRPPHYPEGAAAHGGSQDSDDAADGSVR